MKTPIYSHQTPAKPGAPLEDRYQKNPVKACRLALRLTRSLPTNSRLEAINKLLGMYGTESIRGDWQNGYWCDIVAAYCNAGDSYAVTVMQIRTDFGGSRFIVSSFGDWIEKYGEQYGVI